MEAQQPMNTLAQMLAEVAAMNRDQAVLSRQQLAALQGQAERQTQLLETMVRRAGAAAPAPSFTGMTVHKMAAHDDPQSFLDMFEATAAACGWPVEEWAVRLLPLLSGDAQTAALGLPAPSRGQYGEVKRAVLDRLGLSAEDHRRRFRGGKLGPAERPFIFAQQLKDAATRWLQPGGSAGEGRILEKIVLEQFVEGLPAATSDWVMCHRPADLAGAITLAEDHLAILSRGRAQEGRPGPAATGAASDPQRAPQAAGQECWRCGQLGHFRGECPLMEVGQVIRVVGPPAPSPGPGGTYSVPLRIQGGTHQAMVDSGCMQSIVHQNLIRPGALIEAGGTGDTCAVLSGDARSSDTADGEGEPAGPSQEAPRVPVFDSMEDFPLESRDDTLRFAFDQVIRIDGHMCSPIPLPCYATILSVPSITSQAPPHPTLSVMSFS
ncbi:Zinc finger and SCAN domain-containing protein 23 [Merluccius polli]|uniref:Zinc finger and SCAN domain-containing protein 23 n=1 Tax=Merluccius polli TaxID=89951 RepID=A0AA47NTJ3_MERPO|nr:Zinc finger and SCAN domain-containing protein 23 [Merluccius polli]